MSAKIIVLCSAFAIMIALLPGCLVVSQSATTYSHTGKAPAPETLHQIEPGKTTTDWLLGILGEPHKKVQREDGGETYVYEYMRTKTEQLSVFVLLSSNNKVQQQETFHFQIADGVIQDWWRESTNPSL